MLKINNSDIIFSLNEVLEWTTEAQLSLTLLLKVEVLSEATVQTEDAADVQLGVRTKTDINKSGHTPE